jgi:hypothetical protein
MLSCFIKFCFVVVVVLGDTLIKLQWQDTKLQWQDSKLQWQDSKLQWQDTKLQWQVTKLRANFAMLMKSARSAISCSGKSPNCTYCTLAMQPCLAAVQKYYSLNNRP